MSERVSPFDPPSGAALAESRKDANRLARLLRSYVDSGDDESHIALAAHDAVPVVVAPEEENDGS